MIDDRDGFSLMRAQKPGGKKVEVGLAISQRFQSLNRFDDIFAIGAGTPVALSHKVDALA